MTEVHARILFLPMLVATVLAARGCTAPQKILDPGPNLVRVATLPADDVLLASDLFPPHAGFWRYEIIAGDGEGDLMEYVRQPSDRYGADWANREGDIRTEFWAIDGLGNVHLKAVFEDEDNAVSLFDPPLTLPFELRPGEPHREESKMRVIDADNPAVQRASGNAVRTLEYIDNQRIRVPIGEVTAKRLVLHFRGDMGMATAETRTTYYIVPGLGIVAEETSERVRILGMFGREVDRTMVLVDE